MAQIKVATTLFGRERYRESEITRSAISLKFMYRDLASIIIVTNHGHYITSCHAVQNAFYPVIVCDKAFAERSDLSGYMFMYFGADNPEREWAQNKGMELVEIPEDMSKELSFVSKVYGKKWTYPRFSYIIEYIEKNKGIKPLCQPFVQ